jgi:hypothetical protein
MTFTQAQAESLYDQVTDLQDVLVRRGELHPSSAHDIAVGRVTADGQFLTECTCGRGMFRDTSEESQADYALHIANALGLRVRMGRAA